MVLVLKCSVLVNKHITFNSVITGVLTIITILEDTNYTEVQNAEPINLNVGVEL